ncbi:LysR family transcriptional regulator [Pseudoxanthomonas sangjuensis]|uniref:LysR family transcriptional regulator n=1 Tax=Pseudoxanthomonas sangjuensis TaxID=1503750 RepID=UPI003CCE4796|nr:LysR family transcriptional regulator [Pseudoxanthomonas sangjuensis]
MDMLETCRVFVAVAELGGFTRAADRLGQPKASVSLAVRRLEAALGTQLLHRTTRRVQLTHDGAAFLERCRDLLDDADELQAMFRTEPRSLRGRLRVDMSSPMAARYVIPRLGEFLDRHPQLEIEIGGAERRVDVAGEGYDCVLRIGAILDDSLVARPLGALRIVNCASPDYLRRFGTPRRIEDLAAHRLVHFVGTFGQRSAGWEYPVAGGYANLPMPGAVTVNNAAAYTAAALAGLGLIQTPAIGMRELLESGQLIEVLADFPAEPMPVTLLYPRRRHLPLRVRMFMDWMTDVLAPHLGASQPVGAA